YPSGAVLSLERRYALLEWAQKYGSWIVEDDYDSEFNYTGRPQPALCALAGDTRVCYTGTFSKVLTPALRIAYIVAPEALREPLRASQIVSGGAPDTFVQAALARFMNGGHFARHITKMRKLYDERRRFAASRLARSEHFAVRDSLAGLHFIAGLPAHVRDAQISASAAAHGLIVPALSSYYSGRPRHGGLVIGYAATDTAQAAKAFSVLEKLVSGAGR
ncbi:MAG TPA: PLP-dependent aminotransferase family protein, partial [Candidatus Baltobacteraceae bacterium]|nr:PLP-dependent aminotransferase family protein [Candidatus Baltobacteraceae bacterium]